MRLVAEILGLLRTAGVTLESGLEAWEVRAVQHEYGFEFSKVHGEVLRAALPSSAPRGSGWADWPDWRWGSKSELWDRVTCPIEGVVSGVHDRDFWLTAWGERPLKPEDAEQVARGKLRTVPRMVPLHGYRYLPAKSSVDDPAVFSFFGCSTDVIHVSENLKHYVASTLGVSERVGEASRHRGVDEAKIHRVPFWSDLVDFNLGRH
jgi:hypothetical protein